MSRKAFATTISIWFLLSGLALVAQQAGVGGQASPLCSTPVLPRQLSKSVPCKQVLPGTQSQQPSQELSRDDRDRAQYVSFDVSGAVLLYPVSINDFGAVTGYYSDSAFIDHGFLRDARGNISNIDVPGDGGGTIVYAINNSGTVAGNWCTDMTFTVCPGFLRDRNGTITSFDAPGDAGGTFPDAILDDGTVTGFYFDAAFNPHGFLRTRDGAITEFDVPGAQETSPYSINSERTVAGLDTDSNGKHYFLRARDGNLTTFDIPGGEGASFGGFFGVGQAISINPEGAVAGAYFQPIQGNPFGGNYQGFLRHRDGSIDTFIAADYGPCCIWTFTVAMNPDETIAGLENDGFGNNHGYIRTRDGNITLFEAPGAGTSDQQGTVPLSMNSGRVMTGFYVDGSGVYHGFVRIPH